MVDSGIRNFAGPKIEHDSKTGLSHFILSTTYDTPAGPEIIQLHGLLSELPEISFTVNYEDGSGNEWQDILSNFMTNDLMSIFNAIGAKGAGFKNIVKAGSWTKQVYAGYAPSTIPLKFRIYTRDTFGQSNVEMWKKYLVKFASINDGNKFSIGAATDNIFSAIATAYNTGEDVAELANSSVTALKNTTDVTAGQSNSKSEGNDFISKSMTVEAQIDAIKTALADISALASANDVFKIDMKIEKNNETVTKYLGWGGAYTPITFTASFTDTSSANANVTLDPVEIGRLNAVTMSGNEDPSKIYISYEDLEGAIDDFVGKCSSLSNEAASKIKDTLGDSSKKKIKDAFEAKAPHEAKNNDIRKLGKFIKDNANAIGEIMVSKYDENRVYETMNIENSLGEKLWHLNIYDNVIFNMAKPLVVYISEWSYKASEERDGNDPVYYDFEITCALDQVYSRDTWNKILVRPTQVIKLPMDDL